MSTLRSWSSAIISLLTIGILAGCSEPNGPRGDGQVDELTTLASIQSDFESMKAGSLRLDNAKGVFSIGWRPAPGRALQSAQPVGDAMAIGFEGTGQSGPPFFGGGIDLGKVYLNYSGKHVELDKHTTPAGGVVYSLRPRPMRQMGRPGAASVGLEFKPSTSYEFEVTGATGFSPLKIPVTTPPALLAITSHTDGQSVTTSVDLTLKWSGGTQRGVSIVLAPARGQQHRGERGNPPGPQEVIATLDANPGSYTIPSAKLQEVLAGSASGRIVCGVLQLSSTDVTHDGGPVHAVLRDGARVMLQAQ